MRRRLSVALAGCALLVGLVAGVGTTNPRGYVALQPFAHPVAAWFLGWGLAGAAVVAWRPRRRSVAVLAVPALALGVLTGWTALFAAPTPTRVLDRAVSADGRYEARLVEGRHVIDPYWEVRVRTRRGLQSRERMVWESFGDVEPTAVRFTATGGIEVLTATGEVYEAMFG